MDSVNEELTHDKQAYNTDSSSNTLIEATQNPHDGWDKSNKENEVEQTLNSIPSRTQNCNINVSYSNNQLDTVYIRFSMHKIQVKSLFSIDAGLSTSEHLKCNQC
jgi:hypothetical protein